MSAGVRRSTCGATLVEAVVAIVVLGVAVPPIAGLLSQVAANEPSRLHRTMGVLQAESLLEEIVSKAFEDPDESEGSFGTEEPARAAYDDVDDFDGLVESPPTRFDGTVLDEYPGLQRRATVENVTAADPDPASAEPDGSTGLKRIRVHVVWFDGEVTLTTLRARTGPSAGTSGPPLDVDASVAGSGDDGNRTFWLPLVSAVDEDLVVESFSISTVLAWPPLSGVWLDGAVLWPSAWWSFFPTGTLDVSGLSPAVRTIPAGSSPLLRIRLLWGVGGSWPYTIVLNFTNGTSSTLVVSVDW